MGHSRKEIRINGLSEWNRIENFIEEVLNFHNIQEEFFGNIMLATTETCELVLQRKKKQENIWLKVEKTSNGIAFTISLTGNSKELLFDEIDQAIYKQKLMKEMFIIKSLTDEIEVTDGGKNLTLRFVVTGISFEKSVNRAEKLKKYLAVKEKVTKNNES